jgi:hypothetical protein
MVRSKKMEARPADLRFTKVTRTGLAWQMDRTFVGFDTETPEGGDLKKFDATPMHSYFAAMDLLLDFAVDTLDFGSKWTGGQVDSIATAWTYDDRVSDWVYKLTVSVSRPAFEDDIVKKGFGPFSFTVLDSAIPEEVKEYLVRIWDEAWMYKKGYKFAEKQGNFFEEPVEITTEAPIADCEADGFCEVATAETSAIDDGAFESVVDAEFAEDDMIEVEERELVAA